MSWVKDEALRHWTRWRHDPRVRRVLDWGLDALGSTLVRLMPLGARNVWLSFHRALALSVGFFFVLMGLTGSLNVFQRELDHWLNPQLSVAQPGAAYRPIAEILAAVQAAHPRRAGSWTLVMPESGSEVLTAWFDKPAETYDEFYAPLMVSINPYTAEVVASRFWGDTLMTWILELHTELFMGSFGRTMVGCIGVILLGSLATGLWLWWPRQGRVWEAVRGLPARMVSTRSLSAIHRTAGVYGAVILMLVALTGVHLVFPTWLESLFRSSGSMGDIHDRLDVKSQAVPNARSVSPDESLLIARGLFPKSEWQRLMTPDSSVGSYQVWFGKPSEPANAVVCVDQFSGHILHVENASHRSAGDRFLAWLRTLHTGAAFGLPGRLAWSIAGWIPLVLYITGLRRWRGRRFPPSGESGNQSS